MEKSRGSEMRRESLFIFFADKGCQCDKCRLNAEPSELGRSQFVEMQSLGHIPPNPDPYFLKLSEGKRRFDFLCSEYHKMWDSGEWWGFYQLWKDWEGERWVLPFLCSWRTNIPKWLGLEISEEERWAMERVK